MAKTKALLTIGEQIDRAILKEGRTQKWIVAKMNEAGHCLNEVQFSNKKNGRETFEKDELDTLSTILGTTFTM